MSEYFALILEKIQEDRFNPAELREDTSLSEHTMRRFHLNECVKYIKKIKGRQVKLKFDADEESVPRLKQCVGQTLKQLITKASPLEAVRPKLFPAEVPHTKYDEVTSKWHTQMLYEAWKQREFIFLNK